MDCKLKKNQIKKNNKKSSKSLFDELDNESNQQIIFLVEIMISTYSNKAFQNNRFN